MARRLTKHAVDLAEKRAQRAVLEEKAASAERKARGAKTRQTRLKYIAEAKALRYEAQQLRLRKRSTKRQPKGLLDTVGSMFGG